jgi:hypothetical protein
MAYVYTAFILHPEEYLEVTGDPTRTIVQQPDITSRWPEAEYE